MIHHFAAKLMPEHDVTFRIHGPTIARPAGAIHELPSMLCRVQVAAANAGSLSQRGVISMKAGPVLRTVIMARSRRGALRSTLLCHRREAKIAVDIGIRSL